MMGNLRVKTLRKEILISIVSKSLRGPSATFTSSFESLQNMMEGSFTVLTNALHFGSTTTENPTTASITVDPLDSALNSSAINYRFRFVLKRQDLSLLTLQIMYGCV